MPLEVNWTDRHSVCFTGNGIVSGAECIKANRLVIDDPRLPELRSQLVDLGAVTDYRISAAESQTLAEMDKQAARTAAEVKVAMICPSDLVFGMSKIYAAYTPALWEVRIFRDADAATAWLATEKR
ncbi:MAG: hypothetical protein VW985_02120 [Gammaproteobacteria bacterium]